MKHAKIPPLRIDPEYKNTAERRRLEAQLLHIEMMRNKQFGVLLDLCGTILDGRPDEIVAAFDKAVGMRDAFKDIAERLAETRKGLGI